MARNLHALPLITNKQRDISLAEFWSSAQRYRPRYSNWSTGEYDDYYNSDNTISAEDKVNIKERLETARKTGELSVKSKKLTEFPPGVLQLRSKLRILDLSDNSFINLPSEIPHFTRLEVLNLSKNHLVKIPDYIGELKKLATIYLHHNNLTALPETISKLSRLKHLYLSNNNFKEIPNILLDMQNLTMLDLSNNDITAITKDVRKLYVSVLNLSRNQICEISSNIIDCRNLVTLRLEENKLRIEDFKPILSNESNISYVTLFGNLFELNDIKNCPDYKAYKERFKANKRKLTFA